MCYILILILLAPGCAGRSDKVKVEIEAFKSAYPELIQIYNEGRFVEFNSVLDTIRVMGPSGKIESREYVDQSAKHNYSSISKSFILEVPEDSTIVTILIIDYFWNLQRIEFNQLLSKGTYEYTCNKQELFHGLQSGVYIYYIWVGSARISSLETVLK